MKWPLSATATARSTLKSSPNMPLVVVAMMDPLKTRQVTVVAVTPRPNELQLDPPSRLL